MAVLVGDGRPNEILGTEDADQIDGVGGNDTLHAGAIWGEPPESTAIDEVWGGAGNADLLVLDCRGEAEAVTLGVAGNPRFILTSASGRYGAYGAPDIERVTVYGGSGDDFLETANFGAAVAGGGGIDTWEATYSEVDENIFLHLGVTQAVRNIGLEISGIDRMFLITGSGRDNIAGGRFVDNIVTGAGNDVVNGGAKPVGAPFDQVDGGDGTDTLVVDVRSESRSVQLGVAASPRFIVTSESDRYGVSAYNVELVKFFGGGGNDVINTADMAVAVNGGDGVDHWLADYRNTDVQLNWSLLHPGSDLAELGIGVGALERITFFAGTRGDLVIAGNFADFVDGGAGNDVIDLRRRSPASPEAIDVAVGGDNTDTLVVDASLENQAVTLDSGDGSLNYRVQSVSNRFYVEGSQFERIDFKSGDGNDRATGASNFDTLAGGRGNDTLAGGAGRDSLDGGRLDDVLTGGLGKDDLTGGANRDRFVYLAVEESAAANPDEIHDFFAGTDILDVSAIDANGAGPGDTAFTFIGNSPFHGVAGELRGDFATVQGDVNGDGAADFVILFANGGPTDEAHVIL